MPARGDTGARGGRVSGVAGAALLVTVVTAVSRVSGFAREAVMAAVFGASPGLDAYLVAHQVPNVVIALLSTAVATAAIPPLAARVAGDDDAAAHRLFRTVALVVTGLLGAASAVMALAAPGIVRVLAPGFGPAQLALTTELTRILLLATMFVAGMNLVSGLLNVHRRFFWPAFVGIPFNVAMMVAALVFGPRYGVESLAWGFVAGSVLRVLVQLPAVRRTGFAWAGAVRLRDPGLTAIAGLLPVLLIGHVLSNLNTLVDRMVGSTLESGAIAALNYAYRLVTLPHGLLVAALLQALYPTLSAAAADRTGVPALDHARRQCAHHDARTDRSGHGGVGPPGGPHRLRARLLRRRRCSPHRRRAGRLRPRAGRAGCPRRCAPGPLWTAGPVAPGIRRRCGSARQRCRGHHARPVVRRCRLGGGHDAVVCRLGRRRHCHTRPRA